jgi:hypothetical protein
MRATRREELLQEHRILQFVGTGNGVPEVRTTLNADECPPPRISHILNYHTQLAPPVNFPQEFYQWLNLTVIVHNPVTANVLH